MPTVISELLAHRTVQIALGVVGIMVLGSVAYYLIETRVPLLSYASTTSGSITQTITASGSVSPLENPQLSFVSGGRVTSVNAVVGQKVSAGTVLASLDTGVLGASLAQAQAKLDELIAGPRAVDLAGKQTALESANTTLPDTLRNAEAQAENAVASTDALFTNAGTNPELTALLVNDADAKGKIERERRTLNTELTDWRAEVSGNNADADSTSTHLRSVENYLNDLSTIVASAKTDTPAEATTLAGYTTAVNGARSVVSGLILSVTQAKLAVQSAQDQLSLTQAGSPSQDIDAQRAQVAGIAAQIRLAEIIAPFDGTVGSVSVKQGDVVAPNTTAVSLLPNGNFQVEVFVSEIEMTKLSVGDKADVTLDAYGSSRIFPASVAVVDRAPSQTPSGGQGYKITLVFSQNDPAVTVGMHANVTMHGGSKDSALIVPRGALIEDGSDTYVLKKSGNTSVKTPVTLGLISDTSVEILSGLSAGDQVALVSSH